MADKINYADKVTVAGKNLPDINLGKSGDFNQIKSKYNALLDELGLGTTDDNVRIVSINTGGATNKIKGTLDLITDSSSTKQYLVQVRPGTYIEDDFTIPQYVSLLSTGGNLVTEIEANTTTGTLITMTTGCSLSGFTLKDKTGGIGVSIVSSGDFNINGNSIKDIQTGININNSGSKVTVFNHTLATSASTITSGILCQSGNITVDILKVLNNSTVTNIIRCIGDSIVTTRNIESFSSNVSIGIKQEGTSRSNIYGVSLVACNDGVVIQDGVTGTYNNVKIFNAQQDGFRCDVGTGAEKTITFDGVVLDSSTRYDFNVIDSNFNAYGWVQALADKSFVNPGANIRTQVLDLFSGDEAMGFLTEVHIGSMTRPSESCFGEGDSHTTQLVYTETSGGSFVDVTTEASSSTSSTYTYPGLGVDNAIYVANLVPDSSGADYLFYGVKTIISTAQVGGTVVAEYWNGSAWMEFNACTVESSGSYFKYAKDYFNQTGSFQIKFNPDITDSTTDWVPNDPMLLGDTYYWVRFRVTSIMTTAPIFEQNKIRVSSSEKNPDGSDEYHGNSRSIKKLTLDSASPIEGSMQSWDVYVDQNVGVGFLNNRFTAVGDIYGVKFELPEDCDTSGKLILVWKGRFAAGGSPQFTARLNVVQPGAAYTNSEPGASGNTITELSTIRAVTADVREDFRVDIDISEAIPARSDGFGDEIWISLQYTTRSTSGNFDLTGVSANYLSDQNGRHL